MRIVLTKDSHVGKKGEVKSFPQPRAEYFIRMGLAEVYVKKVEKDTPTKQAVKKEPLEKQAKKTVKKK